MVKGVNVINIQSIYGQNVRIINVFYNNYNIKPYDVVCNYGRKPHKSISSIDKEYIITFINRMDKYLQYIKTNINEFPRKNIYKNSHNERKKYVHKILKTITKIENILKKLSITMSDILIKE